MPTIDDVVVVEGNEVVIKDIDEGRGGGCSEATAEDAAATAAAAAALVVEAVVALAMVAAAKSVATAGFIFPAAAWPGIVRNLE